MVRKPARKVQNRPAARRTTPAAGMTRGQRTAMLSCLLGALALMVALFAGRDERPAIDRTEAPHAASTPRVETPIQADRQEPAAIEPEPTRTSEEDAEWNAELGAAVERNRRAAEEPKPANDEEAHRAEEEAARARAAEEAARARAEEERRGFPRLLAEVEILVGSHQYAKALARIAEIERSLSAADLRACLAPYREEAERATRLLDTFIRQAGAGGLTDADDALDTGMRVAGADAGHVHLEGRGARASVRWTSLTSAQLFDLLRRARLDASGRYDLACFAIDGAPRELGPDAARIVFALHASDPNRWQADVDRAMARLRGLPQVPEGGFVPHGGRLVTVAERESLKKGLVEYLGSWMTPDEKRHRERGEFPVTLADGSVKWVKDAKQLEKLGLVYYAKRDRWYTRTEYTYLRFHWEDAFEVETAHYRIRTNIGEEFSGTIGRILEEAYGLYRERFGTEPKGDEKPWVFLFRSREDYERFCRENRAKGYHERLSAGGFADPARRFCCGYGIDDHDEVVIGTSLHEGAHLFFGMATSYAVPSWYAEGMATGFETYTWDASKGRLEVTPLNRWMAKRLRQDLAAGKALPLDAVLAGEAHEANDDGTETAQRFYSAAWGLYYYLHHAPSSGVREGLAKLDRALASGAFTGGPGRSAALFREAFGDLVAFEAAWRDFVLALPVEP